MIVGSRIRLRAIEAEDLPLLAKWRNDPAVYDCFFEHEPLSLAMQRRWFEDFLRRDGERFWIAETMTESRPLGTVALLNINWRNRRVELGRVVVFPGPDRGQGYGREMCELAIAHAFDHLNVNRVYLEVFADNERATRLYRALGFVEEGRLRQHVFSGGRYRDVLLLSLLRDDRPLAEGT